MGGSSGKGRTQASPGQSQGKRSGAMRAAEARPRGGNLGERPKDLGRDGGSRGASRRLSGCQREGGLLGPRSQGCRQTGRGTEEQQTEKALGGTRSRWAPGATPGLGLTLINALSDPHSHTPAHPRRSEAIPGFGFSILSPKPMHVKPDGFRSQRGIQRLTT